MIYIMGDTHGDMSRFTYPIDNDWTSDDKIIICGDFGFIWELESNENKYRIESEKLKTLESKPYEILFISGNHENFDRLKQFPTRIRYGGKVKQIRKNIFLLMRGQLFTIENHTFFTMGGAYSIDKSRRCEHISWWKEELPNNEEYKTAIQTLKDNPKVDYILTHTAPKTIIKMMKYDLFDDLELTGFFDWMMHEISFKKWFFGHFHIDTKIDYVDNILPVFLNVYKIHPNNQLEYFEYASYFIE